MKTELEERLKQEAQIQAQEARSQRATVREIYQAVTGRTGEPGDWHGSQPVLALIEERDALRRMSSGFGAALITARARVVELEALLRECHLHVGNRYPDDAAMQRRIGLILNRNQSTHIAGHAGFRCPECE